MRVPWLVALLTTALGIALAAGPAGPQKGLFVHEWGVISVYNDVELANADMRSAWDSLPKFVYGNVDGRRVPEEAVLVNVPVMFFHAAQETVLDVKVEFPGGRPAVWWPGNANIHHYSGRVNDKVKPGTYDKRLEWLLTVNPAKAGRELRLQPIPKGHWLEVCRAVKAAEIITSSSDGPGFRTAEKEKFVYYDGIIRSPKAAELRVTAERVSLKNHAQHALLDVTVVDRRTAGKVNVARLASVAAGAEIKALEFADASDRWPGPAGEALVAQLTGAGLNEDEAQALVAVWKKEFFETEGLTLFYRLSQAEYDRLLPLTVTPRPEKVVRALLAYHPHCEPDLGERVMALVKQLDAANFQERLEAHRRIHALGRAAFVHLVRARNAKPSLEVTARLNKLLEEFEAERAFRSQGPADE